MPGSRTHSRSAIDSAAVGGPGVPLSQRCSTSVACLLLGSLWHIMYAEPLEPSWLLQYMKRDKLECDHFSSESPYSGDFEAFVS